jgi:hypothetical protein
MQLLPGRTQVGSGGGRLARSPRAEAGAQPTDRRANQCFWPARCFNPEQQLLAGLGYPRWMAHDSLIDPLIG